jgi:putrescine transport system permease protein
MSFSFKQKMFVISVPYIWLILFTLFPFMLVLVISFSKMPHETLPADWFFNIKNVLTNLTLENYKFIFNEPLYTQTFLESFQISCLTTIACLLISFPTAYGIYKAKPKFRNILLLLVVVPFWTSLLIRVYAWMMIFKNNGIINNFLMGFGLIDSPIMMINTKFAVVVGLVYSYMPFMVLPLYAALDKINPSLMEAAEDLGCGPIRTFIKVILPLTAKGIYAGCLLVFVPSIGELVVPELLGGAKIVTLSKVLWIEFFNNRDWPLAATITILMLFIVIIPIYLIEKIIKNEQK